MRKFGLYTKIALLTVLISGVELAYGSFTGNSDDNKDKFSLRNLHTTNRMFSLQSLKSAPFQYKGSLELSQHSNGNNLQVQSIIRMERGNTTYVYPYKYTVKVPKFVTPKAPIR